MKRFLIELYVIDGLGGYHLEESHRYDVNAKNQYLAQKRREGYKWDRAKKEYLKEPEPCESVYGYSICVTSYFI